MDWFVWVFVFPEVCILLLGFFAIGVSLLGSGELSKLKPLYKPRGSEVDPTYWGQYIRRELKENDAPHSVSAVTVVASTSVTNGGIALPTLKKAPEPAKWDKDWTGGPQ